MTSLNILEWIKNKIDKTQIKNSLTETVVGNVLDSTQGKVLNDKVGVLEVDRGYLVTKFMPSGTDTKTVTTEGKYGFNGGIDMPLGINSGGTYWLMDVIGNTNLLYQEMACVRGGALGRKFYRICNIGEWGDWKLLATTDKIDITPLNGWINHSTATWGSLGARSNGNIIQLTGLLSGGTKTATTVIGVLPTGFRPLVGKKCLAYAYSGTLIETIGLSITISGNIILDNAITGAYLSLCGVSFSID